jgi:hypothetical protein
VSNELQEKEERQFPFVGRSAAPCQLKVDSKEQRTPGPQQPQKDFLGSCLSEYLKQAKISESLGLIETSSYISD